MGTALGKQILANMPEGGIDVVIPVPDSGRTAALELAREIGVPYREGFVKNRYIGRTFIMPGNQVRCKKTVSLSFPHDATSNAREGSQAR